MSRTSAIRVIWWLAGLVFALNVLAIVQVLRTASDPSNNYAPNYVPTALTALAVFIPIFGSAALIKRFDLEVSKALAWLVGAVSLGFALVPWLFLTFGNPDTAGLLYRGLRIPQGTERFWDLALVMRSIDCSAVGVDVFAENNGCLQDPAIYGPGMLWLQHVPFGIFSFSHVLVLGVLMMVISSAALLWLARHSGGIGQVVLLLAALGAPWLLLLERGNVDVVLIWVAVLGVIIVRRWPSLISWSVLAALIWLMGTWKYYPFAMGLMLVPLLWIRRGWIVLAAWVIAAGGFVLLTWTNFRFSTQSNANMTDVGDFVVLGRVPVVARMLHAEFPTHGAQTGDVLIVLLALAALAWGAVIGLGLVRRSGSVGVHLPMLAAAGSAVFLASVLVAGFGYAYKAAFLLLCVPLLASLVNKLGRQYVFAGIAMLALVGVCSIVVWNTLLASLAGITAASFALGLSLLLMLWRSSDDTDLRPMTPVPLGATTAD
ncbi:MAG: hypothetical protein Q8L05_01380 [Actinomycetota bacterium]|nr:hypothetical protein [Actinomycetota bacterium]